MKSKSAREKGKLLENYVADQIVAKGIDPKARRDGGSGSGNREKGDISTSMMVLGQNAGIECKNHSNLAIPEWWRQTKKLEKLGREPILVFKQFGEPMSETKCVIYLDTLLELVKASGGIKVQVEGENMSREQKWALQAMLQATKKVLSEFNQ